MLQQLRIQNDAFGKDRDAPPGWLLADSPMGEGRAEASPVHQDEDSPSIAWDMFLDQRTGSYLLDCSNRRVELRCSADIVDCASIPPLTPQRKPRDACFDDRGKADVLDRALEVGR